MRRYIKLEQIIYSEKEITEEEMENFIDEFLSLVEKYNYMTGGSYGLSSEDEL